MKKNLHQENTFVSSITKNEMPKTLKKIQVKSSFLKEIGDCPVSFFTERKIYEMNRQF